MNVIDELAQLDKHQRDRHLTSVHERAEGLIDEAQLGVFPGSGEGGDLERRREGIKGLRRVRKREERKEGRSGKADLYITMYVS